MKRLLFIAGILLLFATEILRVYFIMPFPGSQHANTIGLAYFIDCYRLVLRLAGLFMIIYSLASVWRNGKLWSRILVPVVFVLYGIVFYFFNFRFEADKMFYQPKTVKFADASSNSVPLDKLVIGIVVNGQAKAYPIQVIGYHHQVRDSIGGTPVMITYCTVCRTGRVYSPVLNGEIQQFRLVGMDHFNAMFEDAATKSWWQQATGVSIAGPLKGKSLLELPSTQSTLRDWIGQYPSTTILQPDTIFRKHYDDLADFDKGTIKGSLEKRDSASWKAKSWVIGVKTVGGEKAYDWNELVRRGLIEDIVGGSPIVIALGPESSNFHVWNASVDGQTLHFQLVAGDSLFKDTNTGSSWRFDGRCVSGKLKDQQLHPVQSYQEFWHSWSHFHPETTQYSGAGIP